MTLNLNEYEMSLRKRKQKNEAQKRYYQKNKEYYRNYYKERYAPKSKRYKQRLEMVIEYMTNYIEIEPDNSTTLAVKCEFEYLLKLAKEGEQDV